MIALTRRILALLGDATGAARMFFLLWVGLHLPALFGA